MNSFIKLVCAVSFATCLSMTGCGGDKSGGNGVTSSTGSGSNSTHSTPDAVFSAFKAAATDNDLKKFMNCMSAKSQDEFTFMTIIMSTFLPLNHMDDQAKADALGKEIEAALSKHGLSKNLMNEIDPTAEPDFKQIFAPVKDKTAFVEDLFAIITREDPDTPLKQVASSTMKEVKVDGDKASGTIIVDGNEEEIGFVKEGGSWRIQMPGMGEPDLDEPGPEN